MSDVRDLVMVGSGRRLEEIPVDVIKEPEMLLRKLASSEGMAELLRSIAERGVLVPVIVEETKEGYRLIAGRRRYLCARQLKLATIPAMVVKESDEWKQWATLAENRVREAVNVYDEALWLAEVVKLRDVAQGEVAKSMGVSEGWVSQRLGVLKWPYDVRQALMEGDVSFGVGRELAGIKSDGARSQALRMAKIAGCSVRQAAQWRRAAEADSGGVDLCEGRTGEVESLVPQVDDGGCLMCREVSPRDTGGMFFVCHPCQKALEEAQAEESQESTRPQAPDRLSTRKVPLKLSPCLWVRKSGLILSSSP